MQQNQVVEQNQERAVTVYDVMVAEEAKSGKTYWHNLGVAFPLANGSNGLALKLFMFPNLRIVVKESVRAVGSARQASQQNTASEEVPY